jgi:hypothetical protein
LKKYEEGGGRREEGGGRREEGGGRRCGGGEGNQAIRESRAAVSHWSRGAFVVTFCMILEEVLD